MSSRIEQLDRNFVPADIVGQQAWYDIQTFGIEGRGFNDVTTPYDRLPARANGVVRPDVWLLSHHSAGLRVRFVTDAHTISARWSLRFDSMALPHMPATGVSGLDLYIKINGQWRWQAMARPSDFPTNEVALISADDPRVPIEREFMLYLPLYNGVTKVELGVPMGTKMRSAPAHPKEKSRPICCYGTSIVQGGCASRPGMAYPAILGRMFDWPFLNIGFTGNGRAEPEVAQFLAEIDPEVFILDPLPNLLAYQVEPRLKEFVHILRKSRPNTPILLVENITYQQGEPLAGRADRTASGNAALMKTFNDLRAEGITGLHYVTGSDLLGHDGEGTVDGTHPTDVGFQRMAEVLAKALQPFIGDGSGNTIAPTRKVTIKKDIIIPAAADPADHSFFWTINPSYTSKEGNNMVLTSVRWISNGEENWRDRRSVIQRMRSEDSGATWKPYGPANACASLRSNNRHLPPHHHLDPQSGKILSIFQTTRPGPENGASRTALHYEISGDQGLTWSKPRQIICPGAGVDEIHWMPAMVGVERYIGVDQPTIVRLDDGTLVFGITLHRPNPNFPAEQLHDCVVYLRGRWNSDQSEIAWEASPPVRVPSSTSPFGIDEPDLVHLGGQRILSTLRCEGMLEPHGIFSTRQWTLSEDGGKTWSEPQTLTYEDGSMVCVPASLSAFEKHPISGKIYWFANIQDRPLAAQMPRYPLRMAELDPNRICIIKDSVTMIQDLPPGAPANRSYSNFGHYVDRVTGEIVLMMSENPKFSDFDYRADTIRFRIRIDD